MPDYRIKSTGEVINNLQMAFPNVSIPLSISPEDLNALGVDPILEGAQPILTRFQSVVKTGPEQDAKGNWTWVYIVVDWSEEQIEEATTKQWGSVRTERDVRLQNSDWSQLPDVPLTEDQKIAWVEYRQALRDVTNQTDPFDIVWPVKPTPYTV